MLTKSWAEFVQALGKRESGNRYHIKNKLCYLGRFQFGLARLADLGLCKRKPGTKGHGNSSFQWTAPYSESVFLASHDLQDRVCDVHVAEHRAAVISRHSSDIGKVIGGVELTLSGAVACCHLLGPGGLSQFIRGEDGADANGTTASDYVKLFAHYDIPTDLPRRGQVDFKIHLNQGVS
jgi:hypothetical protein